MAKFEKGNTESRGRGRPPGSGYRSELLAVVDKTKFKKLVENLFKLAEAGDMSAASVLINRLVPPLKPRDESVLFKLPYGTMLERADAVLVAVSRGELSPGEGKLILEGMAAVMKIREITDMIPRLEALEGR